MEHCQDYFHHLSLDTTDVRLSSSVVQILQDYYTEASKFSMDNFSALNDMVLSLESPQQLQQWNSVWRKCQQTKQQLEETLARATTAASDIQLKVPVLLHSILMSLIQSICLVGTKCCIYTSKTE